MPPHMRAPEDWKELEEIYDYWDGKTYTELCMRYWPPEVKKAIYPAEFRKIIDVSTYETVIACPSPDIKMVLAKGLNGIMRELVEPRLAELDEWEVPAEKLQETLDQKNELNVMMIVGKAVVKWAQRYSQLAKEMVGKTADPEDKARLEQIAKNCARVPAEPAETFWQAIQSFWFVHLVGHVYEELSPGPRPETRPGFHPLLPGRHSRQQADQRESPGVYHSAG